MKRKSRFLLNILLLAGLAIAQLAPGVPGAKSTWANGNKTGVGTANTLDSKVWFTLGQGTLDEVYYPTIDKANTRTLVFIVTDGKTFAEIENQHTDAVTEVVDPAALVFRQTNKSKSGRYTITKTWITDPARDAVLAQVQFKVLKPMPGAKLYVFYDPAINNSGMHDTGYTMDVALIAADGGIASALVSNLPFTRTTSTFFGKGGWLDIKDDYKLDGIYSRAADGNVSQVAELPAAAISGAPFTIALGFGSEGADALAKARASLKKGFAATLAEYSKGWHDYIATLKKVDPKYQAQYQMSAMVLKAHEDKIYRGAGAASLTIPWGDGANADEPSVGGYHLVWARDLYQVATAFLAMGDKEAADRALNYLLNTQQKKDGSFPQNSWLDGRPFWGSLQMDEVAYPIVLAYQLGRTDNKTYEQHVKPAANFIVSHGPATPQERWEEEGGYSPSTIAAEIAGLVCAADIARRNYDEASATLWLAAADDWNKKLESWTVTSTGPYAKRYYVRIAQHGQPDAGEKIEINNGGGTYDEREIVDAGFLELVRLGLRKPDDPLIQQSLGVIDKVIRRETKNGPGWYRYNHDGYGEKDNGKGYDGTGMGRLWILFAGERGEFELANGRDPKPYLDVMQKMANSGRMLAEQVWDRDQSPSPQLRSGEGTGSATPLAWTNAQFIRLAVAAQEGRLPEQPEVVAARYLRQSAQAAGAPPRVAMTPIPSGRELKPGQKLEIGTVADGDQVVVFVNGETQTMERGHLDIPVVVGAGPEKLTVAARNADGSTAFDQMEIAPTKEMKSTLLYPNVPEPAPSDAKFAEQLKSGKSPLMNGPWVTFVYRGAGKEVEVVGEFTDWDKRGLKCKSLEGTDIKYFSMQFPPDARIEYKIIVDGNWLLDTLNPNKKDNGVGGENSFFTMPEYKPTTYMQPKPQAGKGRFEDMDYPADAGKTRKVRIYLPAGYDASGARYPSIYFGDGQEYIDRIHAEVIMENLVAEGKMRPAVLVFVPPMDRMKEYWLNASYLDWEVKTLVPAVDAKYRTINDPAQRAHAGASLGGLLSEYAAFQHPEVFGVVLGQSAAFIVNNGEAISALAAAEKKSIRFYLDVGTYEGLIGSNRQVKKLLKSKGYELSYHEYSQGHNWTHWGDALPDALTWTFPKSSN